MSIMHSLLLFLRTWRKTRSECMMHILAPNIYVVFENCNPDNGQAVHAASRRERERVREKGRDRGQIERDLMYLYLHISSKKRG